MSHENQMGSETDRERQQSVDIQNAIHTLELATQNNFISPKNKELAVQAMAEAARLAQQGELSPQYAERIVGSINKFARICHEQGDPLPPDGIRENFHYLKSFAEQPPAQTEQAPEYRPSADTVANMRDFMEFADQGIIEQQMQRGLSLEDAIYDRFYSENWRGQKYNADDPRYHELAAQFDLAVPQAEKWAREMQAWSDSTDDRLGFNLMENQLKNDWLYVKTHGGIDTSQPVGRLYLNLNPVATPDFYTNASNKLFQEGIGADIKMTNKATPDEFNRPDKIVIYFNEGNQDQILKILNGLHDEYNQYFMDEVPKFTAQMANDQNERMQGIGFAEQPLNQRESFGGVRSKILAEVYATAQARGVSVNDRSFPIAQVFKAACEKYGVDPEEAAFNKAEPGQEKFQSIRSRRVE